MIGKGKAISHTRASIFYGWNQEKNAEIIHSQFLAGENPKEISEEFKIIQEQNQKCQRNTLSFVLSPSTEDGQRLSNEQLKELTQSFINKMELKEYQAIAFVHRDKQHTHIHLYVNRIGFDGKAYKDNFIGKRSQQAAHEVAEDMKLIKARDIQWQRLNELKQIRQEIKQIHEQIMRQQQPRNFNQYISYMSQKKVKVIPSINKSQKVQGFRFQYKGQSLKGSEVHRSMSGGRLTLQILGNSEQGVELAKNKSIQLADRTLKLSNNLATKITKKVLKMAVKRVLDQGIGI